MGSMGMPELFRSCTRRTALQGGSLAMLGTLLPSGARGAEADAALLKLPLVTRTIPATGQPLPVIGLGTNAFKNAVYDDAKAVLRRMHELGGIVIDTASDYPNPSADEAEGVIGRALGELGLTDKMFLCTKANADGFQPDWAPRDNIFGRASFDRSLARLGRKHVDLMYVHHVPSIDPLMPLVMELKQAGLARYIGITTQKLWEHEEVVEKMRKYPIDFVQVDYSLANRDVATTILPVAQERGIAVTVDIPLGGRRASLLQEIGDKVLPPWAAEFDATSWSQFFLKYVISHPAVTCALPGTTNAAHLAENQLACRGRLPDAAMRKRMETFWDA